MTTLITPELSKSNKYYISRHRYYELKHFCLQYPEWKRAKKDLYFDTRNSNYIDDPTGETASQLAFYNKRIELIDRLVTCTDEQLSAYILKAVTEGRSFTNLKTVFEIPCGKDLYYDRYRRFFWLLDKER